MSIALSDYTEHFDVDDPTRSNVAGFSRNSFTSQIVSNKTFTDISFNFIHPQTGNVLLAKDLEAIRNSLKNIILTPKGTRPFYPEFGTGVSNLLFELADNLTAVRIKEEIEDAINKWEPRVGSPIVNVQMTPDENTARVSIQFITIYGGTGTVQLTLNRIR